MNCSSCESPIPSGRNRCNFCGKWQMGSASSKHRKKLREAATDEVSRLATEAIGAVASNGGFPRGCVTLVGGEPGTGKSTMAIQLASHFSSCLYVASEESDTEIRNRVERLRLHGLLDTVDIVLCSGEVHISTALEGPPCELVILDSLPGLVGQNDASAIEALKTIKKHVVEHRSCALVIDHATKNDFFAGRLALQHEVDCTLVFTCDTPTGRILVSVKNRHGPSGKEERLELTDAGLVPRPPEPETPQKVRGPRP